MPVPVACALRKRAFDGTVNQNSQLLSQPAVNQWFAEGTRFELVVQNNPYGSLANCWFQPLTHPSGNDVPETPEISHKSQEVPYFLRTFAYNNTKTMKKPWILPAIFFLVAALVNWATRLFAPELSALVKPALMPLLALTTLAAAGTLEPREMKILITAQLLGCAGDIFLIGSGIIPLGCGLGMFLLGHVCYLTIFGGRSWKGLSWKVWLPALIVMAALVYGLTRVIGIEGAMLVPMFIYGMVLMLLIFSGLMGVIRLGGATWWIIFAGGVIFTFSDCLVAAEVFDIHFPGIGFVVMFTYLLAQCLLAWGALRLFRNQ